MKIISPQITLNPGFDADGKRIATATVRLLTRAERTVLNQLADLQEQEERYFVEQIQSFGSNEDRNYIEQCVGLLLWPDEERLNEAMGSLIQEHRDPKFRTNKHTCPGCGREVPCERAISTTS